VDVCPCDCIHPLKDEAEFSTSPQLYINPDDCIDCGACIPVCPVSAIFPIEDLPKKWNGFAEINARGYEANSQNHEPRT
jgi:ferredoxin